MHRLPRKRRTEGPHRDRAVDGVADGALHLGSAARVHQHHAAILVGAHQLRHLAACAPSPAVLSQGDRRLAADVSNSVQVGPGKAPDIPPAGGTGVICPQRAQRTFCAPWRPRYAVVSFQKVTHRRDSQDHFLQDTGCTYGSRAVSRLSYGLHSFAG